MPRTKSKRGTRKYGKKAQEEVHEAMHEMKEGKLRSGKSGKKVTNPKQAVAIGLSRLVTRGRARQWPVESRGRLGIGRATVRKHLCRRPRQ